MLDFRVRSLNPSGGCVESTMGVGGGASYPARYCPSHLCIASSHFWPFTKANLVLINFSKTFKSGPPPPFVFLAGEAGVGITFSRSWIYSNLPHFKHSYCYCIDKRLVKVVGRLFVHIRGQLEAEYCFRHLRGRTFRKPAGCDNDHIHAHCP